VEYSKEVFREQLPLVDLFARHLLHYRVIKAHLDDRRPQSPFWSDTCDAHLLQATGRPSVSGVLGGNQQCVGDSQGQAARRD
jgi:hypothetical protein